MNQEWKEMLQDAFEAPSPQNKEQFFRKLNASRSHDCKITYWQFLFTQVPYIRKWIWALSFVVFAIAVVWGQILERDILWMLAAMMPFLAISLIAENVRSEVYGMAELEKASRFSLKSVLLARLGILGLSHLGLLCLLALLGYRQGGNSLFQTGVYLLVPYLLTDAGGLWLVRKLPGKEAVYAGVGLAVVVSALPIWSRYTISLIYEEQMFHWWLAALIILCVVVVSEWKKNLKRTEEYIWSLL